MLKCQMGFAGAIHVAVVCSGMRAMHSQARFNVSVPNTRHSKRFIRVCKAFQDKTASQILAEIVQSPDKDRRASELVDGLNEEFFYTASAYLSAAREQSNEEYVEQIETALKAASLAKEKTYRPEVQLFNQLLRNKSLAERDETIRENHQYLHEGSYFFELLENVMKEEAKKDTAGRSELMRQLKLIQMQTTKVAEMLKSNQV